MRDENNDIAFHLMQFWRHGHYQEPSQAFAKLQILIAEALDNKDKQREVTT